MIVSAQSGRRQAAQLISLLLLANAGQPAQAQSTDRNVVLQAADAFGKSIGRESIGIYNADDVRGFSPAEAGNLRIEGLYFDEQGGLGSQLTNEETIRVGISAQGYAFPAPTGIVDYGLRRAGETLLLETVAGVDSWGGAFLDSNLQVPRLLPRTSLSAGISIYRERTAFGGTPRTMSAGGVGRWEPADDVEILPFAGIVAVRDEEVQPRIFTDGDFLPPRIARRRYFGQKWAVFDGDLINAGMLARAKIAGVAADIGVFHSLSDEHRDHSDLLFGTNRQGAVSDRIVIVTAGDSYASTSGELRLSRKATEGPRSHALIASVRMRRQVRRYGGVAVVELGASRIDRTDERPEPETAQDAKTRDVVRQTTLGLSYDLVWPDVGEVSLGAQKAAYRKRVTAPAPEPAVPVSRSQPLLWSATAAAHLTSRLALYGGITEGLEESPIAPSNAVNLNEAPPAIRTRQREAGLRWTIKPKLTLVAGAFTISKPYFNLDGDDLFRQLGRIRNRGVEISLSGEVAPGIDLLAGALLLDATVAGEEVARGELGRRPIGVAARRLIVNVNVQVPRVEGLSFEVGGDATSSRVANALDTLRVPGVAEFSLAGRYKFAVGRTPALLRLQVDNLLDTFNWSVDGSGAFTANRPRRVELSLSADM